MADAAVTGPLLKGSRCCVAPRGKHVAPFRLRFHGKTVRFYPIAANKFRVRHQHQASFEFTGMRDATHRTFADRSEFLREQVLVCNTNHVEAQLVSGPKPLYDDLQFINVSTVPVQHIKLRNRCSDIPSTIFSHTLIDVFVSAGRELAKSM